MWAWLVHIVNCKVYSRTIKPYGVYHFAVITGAENVAKEIKLTPKCIRTKAKRQQIQAFKTELTRPRKRPTYRPIRKARKILRI